MQGETNGTDDTRLDASDRDEALARRNLLKLGGVAAAGAGLAAVANVVHASPAGAASGNLQYGASNDADTDATDLTSTNADAHARRRELVEWSGDRSAPVEPVEHDGCGTEGHAGRQ